jgi:Protein of unknown function (DUF3618)
MTENPDQIRREIELTRQDLAGDVDALHEKVSPSAIAGRKVDSARSALATAKDKVMGATPNGSGDGVTGRVSSAASSITDSVEAAPSAARRQTRGNPLAAGLIAFGAGWLVASLIPASEKEKSAATTVTDAAGEHSDFLTAPAKEAAQNVAEGLKEPARHAAESVKQTATDGVTTVRDDTANAKDDLVDQMRSS